MQIIISKGILSSPPSPSPLLFLLKSCSFDLSLKSDFLVYDIVYTYHINKHMQWKKEMYN
jgi:hypothetical protein